MHGDAGAAATTDWWQIRDLYDQLLAVAPSPVAELNRAVAVAEVDGPDAGLVLVDALNLDGYHVFHAVRADLLRRLDRPDEATRAYARALDHTDNEAEQAFLRRMLGRVSATS